ncbi:hypothetical protein Caci_1936 [Catenulispora acidiphila DSM 44928]|uniref:Uncharacterized protein n=1 Tax=Catenulispora acidiphila (strain DSM 44928 / JCM 14897 / NBRC 102108 / NRRL B-24433 / ID139908) TaxID=479433 RepID=C7QEG5_CATAD|nr:hypothetical protein Caci_1936 [Catenulispora acidiphila DSM 44928]
MTPVDGLVAEELVGDGDGDGEDAADEPDGEDDADGEEPDGEEVVPVVGELVGAPSAFPCEESHAPVNAAAPSAAMPPRRIVRLVLIRFSIRQNPHGARKERRAAADEPPCREYGARYDAAGPAG